MSEGAVRVSSPRARAVVVEAVAVFLAAVVFYVVWYSPVPYHDVFRFRAQIESGKPVWDIAHVWLQPATLWWHRHLGFGESAVASQRHINTFATALAIALFDVLLLRLRRSGWERFWACLLLAGSASVMLLAPTGHMKLVAFPFINAALLVMVQWERARELGTPPPRILLPLGCLLLAVAAAFLVSALATGPFVVLALYVVGRRAGMPRPRAALRAVLWGAACLALFCAQVFLSYHLFAGSALTPEGFSAAVSGKAAIGPSPTISVSALVREILVLATNFIAAPDFGAVGHAFMQHEIPRLAPYSRVLVEQGLPVALTLLIVAAIYVAILRALLQRRPGVLMAVAFLAGAQAWTIYYQINDPEDLFGLGAPMLLLFLILLAPAARSLLLPVWAAATVAINIVLITLPLVRYPYFRARAELAAALDQGNLAVTFAAFPGRVYLGSFDLPGVDEDKLDEALKSAGSIPGFEAAQRRMINAALAAGRHVYVFGVLDPTNWNAPWSKLAAEGMTKARLYAFIGANWRIVPHAPIGDLPTWELLPDG